MAETGSEAPQPQEHESCKTTSWRTQVPIEHRKMWAALCISFFDQCTKAVTTETQQLGIPNTTAILRTANLINGLGGGSRDGLEIKCVQTCKTQII